jgi:hypothetical protein
MKRIPLFSLFEEWIMKKSRLFLALLFVSLSFVLMPATAKADLWDVPVASGESFRWVFVTSETMYATSSDISVYNDFVNAAADAAGTTITGVVGKSSIADIDWKVIGSTATVNAIDNIVPSSAGIYLPTGILVANGTTDMFDGSLSTPISITETGSSKLSWVYTGSTDWGTANIWPLGYSSGDLAVTITGHTNYSNAMWINKGISHNYIDCWPLYAISEELTVVPIPGALMLGVTGLLSSILGLKRLRRKGQE